MDETREGTPFAVARAVTFSKDISEYCVLGAKDPFDFLMVHKSDLKNCFHLSGGRQKLQDLVEEAEISMYKEEIIKPEINKIYIFYCSTSDEWHRCRLLSFNEHDESALIYFFDYYLEEYIVPWNELREMPSGLMESYPVVVPVYRCHLYDIMPVGGGSYEWSELSIKWFTCLLTKSSSWKAMQMSWRERRVPGGDEGADVIIDLGIVLFENSMDEAWMDRLGSMNWKLVLKLQAKAIGVGGSYFSSLFFNDGEPMFSMNGMPDFSLPAWCNDPIPIFGSNRLCQFLFRSYQGPDCIYVTLINKYKEVKAIHHYINQSEKVIDLERKDIRPGKAVLVEYDKPLSIKVEPPKHTKFHRVRGVVLHPGGALVRVFLVDFGLPVWVSIDKLSDMNGRLEEIPAFVHRLHLNSIYPIDRSREPYSTWSVQENPGSRNHFNAAIRTLESVPNLAFFAIRENPKNDIVPLDRVGQALMFDKEHKRWTGKPEKLREVIPKSDLVNNLLYSIGVDISYLKPTSSDSEASSTPWKFQSLAELFIKNPQKYRAGRTSGKRMNKQAYYDKLVDMKDEEYV